MQALVEGTLDSGQPDVLLYCCACMTHHAGHLVLAWLFPGPASLREVLMGHTWGSLAPRSRRSTATWRASGSRRTAWIMPCEGPTPCAAWWGPAACSLSSPCFRCTYGTWCVPTPQRLHSPPLRLPCLAAEQRELVIKQVVAVRQFKHACRVSVAEPGGGGCAWRACQHGVPGPGCPAV